MTLPVFHASAASVTHISALKAGTPTYIMRRFNLETFLTSVERYGITDVSTVPPIVVAVIMSPLSCERGYLKNIRAATCGAAPLDKDLQARFRALLSPSTPFTQVWGMTETCRVATMFPYPEHDTTGSVGRLIPNLEAKVIDNEGRNISAFGVRGELCVRGPTIIPGYFNNEAANADSFDSDGWYKTGDIAYCEAGSRKWFIVDRKKELIKVRGFQVAPPELEAVLLSHPGIVDAAVIGVSVPGADTEFPRAYVVRRDTAAGKEVTEKEVLEFMAGKLARYKSLTGGVKFVEGIAKNASGKVLKRVLRDEAKREADAGILVLRPKL